MQKLIIKGKKNLSGTISISGSKNATLPILAATILAENVTLTNVPLVKDIFTMLDLLKFIGIKMKINKLRRSIKLTGKKKKYKYISALQISKNNESRSPCFRSIINKI